MKSSAGGDRSDDRTAGDCNGRSATTRARRDHAVRPAVAAPVAGTSDEGNAGRVGKTVSPP